jgi:HAD superfamily hydrolase (TIGR01509 family)
MPIRGVAFDLEGTLVDVERAHHEGHLAAAAEVGVSLTLEKAIERIDCFIGGPDKAVAAGIWKLSNKSKSVDEIHDRDKYHYERILPELAIEPRPGVVEAIQWIQKSGYAVAVGSLTARANAEVLLTKSGLDQIFAPEQIVLAEDVQELKPNPDVFLETARRMGIDPTEQLVFEDSPGGIEAARSAGSLVVAMPVYNRPATILPLIELGASRIFADWREISLKQLFANLDGESAI